VDWTFTRGLDLCWQTITTVGRYIWHRLLSNFRILLLWASTWLLCVRLLAATRLSTVLDI
jgi:hypothetical protein